MDKQLTTEELLRFLRENRSFIQKEFNVVKIGVFGSFARGDSRTDSDIDLLVEFADKTPDIFEAKENLREWLKETFDRKIDLAREKYLKPRVRESIVMETIYA